ncbi:MAG: hypothetical protein IKJ25_00640 [Clostridia bacterium]|nr:hypothetical protein [Clostridia bacterium]
MKRIISSIIVLCLVFAMTSCVDKTVYHWEFEQDYTSIKEIKVVYIPSYESSDLFDVDSYIVIKNINISYAQEIFIDVQNMKMEDNRDPLGMPHDLSLLIVFENGELNIINNYACVSAKYNEDSKLTLLTALLTADKIEFEQLIIKCLTLE